MSDSGREDDKMTTHEERLADIARRREAAEQTLRDIEAEQEPAILAAWQGGVHPQEIASLIGMNGRKVDRVIRRFERADEYAAREADRKRRLAETIAEHGMKPMDS